MNTLQRAIDRLEAEYREMPGLVLTAREAERLVGLDRAACEAALSTLTRRRFLKKTVTGTYLRQRPG
jgi:predicted transcriptional regulator of viral defense system